MLAPRAEPLDQRGFETPVLLVIFNRLDTTKAVFEAIRECRPSRLYVAADGPRPGHAGEEARTSAVREYVMSSIDWDCEVQTLFRSKNLGVKPAVGGAITWFFSQEEEGIILEDDCLPSQSFFWFCQELLDRYRDEERVMQIAGGCYIDGPATSESYFFSKYPHIWGWASWKTAWDQYRPTSDDFETEFDRMRGMFGSEAEKAYWYRTYRDYFGGKYQSWAYAWTFSVWRRQGLSIYPTRNLVKNIGFGSDALHTKGWKDYRGLQHLPLESFSEIRHPAEVRLDQDLDVQDFEAFFKRPPLPVLFVRVMKHVLLSLPNSLKKGRFRGKD